MSLQPQRTSYESTLRVYKGGIALFRRGKIPEALDLFLDAYERCELRDLRISRALEEAEALNDKAGLEHEGQMNNWLAGKLEEVIRASLEKARLPFERFKNVPYAIILTGSGLPDPVAVSAPVVVPITAEATGRHNTNGSYHVLEDGCCYARDVE